MYDSFGSSLRVSHSAGIFSALPAAVRKAYDARGDKNNLATEKGNHMPLMPLSKRLLAELIGTFWLVLGGCGSAVLSAAFPAVGIGLLGVALAFGLTVVTMAYAIGHISGCHLNPAITFGLFVGGRHPGREILPYWIAQVLGGIAAAGLLLFIASGNGSDPIVAGLAANGVAEHSPGHYSLAAGFVCEIVMTAVFLFVIMGATDKRTPGNFAPLAIGLCLTLIHLISIPVTNTSVNPARSTGPAVFVGGWALGQLWIFWVAPLIGGALGALAYRLTRGPEGGPGLTDQLGP
jgi:aquaporin Z